MSWIAFAQLIAEAVLAIARLADKGLSADKIRGRIRDLEKDFDAIDADAERAARGSGR